MKCSLPPPPPREREREEKKKPKRVATTHRGRKEMLDGEESGLVILKGKSGSPLQASAD